METTSIAPDKTVGEITSALVAGGANQINTEYEKGKLKSLRWTMRVAGSDVLFDMPARVEPIYRIFLKRRGLRTLYEKNGDPYYANEWEKAERVAWRQLLRWVQAQLAMIDTGMVQPAEVFLAYMVHGPTGQTLFQHMMETRFKALPPAS